MTRYVRLFALTLLVLAVASPSFAACRFCNDFAVCERDLSETITCRQFIDYCTENNNCVPPMAHGVLMEEYAVASVEVTTPSSVPQKSGTPLVAALRDARPAGRR